MTRREQHDKSMRHSTWGYRMEKMRIRLGYNAYYMRHWLRLLRHSRSLSSYPLPMSMLTPGDINRNTLLQTSLPYIVLQMVHANYHAPYPKQPCVVHEVNMWYSCCMMSSVLKSSTKFSQVSWSVLWLHHQVVTDVTSWLINLNPSCSKNRKIEK